MTEAYIYDAVRTPRGRGKSDGSLHEVSTLQLAAGALRAVKERNNLDTRLIDDVILGCVDTVGGSVLAFGLKSVVAGGAVTCCGNIMPELPITVYPFILRGVSLFGIDSQNCPMALRREVWGLLAGAWKFPWLSDLAAETTLEGLEEKFALMKAGTLKGRTVVRLT